MGNIPSNRDGAGDGKALAGKTWMDHELETVKFKDIRLERRFRKLLEQMFNKIGQTIPLACQDWTNTKAAYRFFSNERVSETELLAGHFTATRERFSATEGPVLILHDTTEFTYLRNENADIGLRGSHPVGKNKDGSAKLFTDRGIFMHSSLAVTPEGLPLGLAAIKFWSREQFKAARPKTGRRINESWVPIEEKESYRWLENLRQSTALFAKPASCVHVGDRESDIYELFCAAAEVGTHFVIRANADRMTRDTKERVSVEMMKVEASGLHRVRGRTKGGDLYEADLEIKYQLLKLVPPVGKKLRYPDITLTIIHASERGTPKGRERIEWKLITNLVVNTLSEATEKLDWYAMRWKIETFHKILKSGCKAEESKLRTSDRLIKLVSVYCLVSWRIFWMTMINRIEPDAPPEIALTPREIHILDRLIPGKPWDPPPKKNLSEYLIKIARAGGYLARKSDPPPGNIVIWRGMARLIDIQIGYALAEETYG